MSFYSIERVIALRADIERLKGAILTEADEVKRVKFYADLGACMSEYLALLDEHIRSTVHIVQSKREEPLQERQLGAES
jgi:hypothetical protein